MIPFLLEILLYTVFAFLFAISATPFFIDLLKKYHIGKNLREEAVDGTMAKIFNALHAKKAGTPSMGGILIWGTVLITVFFSRALSFLGVVNQSILQRSEVYLPLFTLVFVGILGAVDDFLNVRGIGKTKGLNFWIRSSILLFFGLLGALWFYFKLGYTGVHVPFYGEITIGAWYIPLFILVIFFTANAVNVTDGLDGLAGGLLVIAFSVCIALAFAREHYFLAFFCGSIVGALLAFLWHNIPPAKFYMGDTGSFALGATLGVIVMMIDVFFILPFIGFIFFMEALSVALQLWSKKYRGKKIFHIAPIHHHFEHLGWGESQVVMRFWIIGVIFAIIGLLIGLIAIDEQKMGEENTKNGGVGIHQKIQNIEELQGILLAGRTPIQVEKMVFDRGCNDTECTLNGDQISIVQQKGIIRGVHSQQIISQYSGNVDEKNLPEIQWDSVNGVKIFQAGKQWGTCLNFSHSGIGSSGTFQRWRSVVLIPWENGEPKTSAYRFMGYWADCYFLMEGISSDQILLPTLEFDTKTPEFLNIIWHTCTSTNCVNTKDSQMLKEDPSGNGILFF